MVVKQQHWAPCFSSAQLSCRELLFTRLASSALSHTLVLLPSKVFFLWSESRRLNTTAQKRWIPQPWRSSTCWRDGRCSELTCSHGHAHGSPYTCHHWVHLPVRRSSGFWRLCTLRVSQSFFCQLKCLMFQLWLLVLRRSSSTLVRLNKVGWHQIRLRSPLALNLTWSISCKIPVLHYLQHISHFTRSIRMVQILAMRDRKK